MARRAVLPIAAAACACVVVAASAVEGNARVVPFSLRMPTAPLPTPLPQPTRTAASGPVGSGPGVIGTVLLVLAAVAALVLLAIVVRALVRRVSSARRALPPPALPTDPGVVAPEAIADAPAVRRGIRAALDAFDAARGTADAVVAAWVGLQQAAEDAGLPRHPAETPTEFALRVLARTAADREAVTALLGLYLRARFGGELLGSADGERARAALAAIEGSWHADRVPA